MPRLQARELGAAVFEGLLVSGAGVHGHGYFYSRALEMIFPRRVAEALRKRRERKKRERPRRAAWMKTARLGVMTHYLADGQLKARGRNIP
jgi:hypothetical protein